MYKQGIEHRMFNNYWTVILSVNEDSRRAASDLQHHLNTLQTWFQKWRIRINENKSCSITITFEKSSTLDLTINDIQIPRKTEIKYIGMTIDSRLTWKQHIVKKRKQVNITIKRVNWLLGRKSNLAIENKLLIYKTIIIPTWTYGLELWGCVG
jgi:hypothetical protein